MWIAVAAAGVPVDLPDTEQPGDWVAVLALGAFDWGGPGAPIVVADRGSTWQITVKDGAGAARITSVAPPRNADEREDLVWLVVSLSGEVAAPPPPPEPEPAPVSAVALPIAAPRPIARHEVARTAPPEVPADEETLDPEPLLAPVPHIEPIRPAPSAPAPRPRPARPPRPAAPEDPGLRPWVRVGGGPALGGGLDPRVAGALSGGVGSGRQALGIAVGASGRSALPAVGRDRAVSAWGIAVEGWTGPRWVRIGAALGAERRVYTEAGQRVAAAVMPVVRVDLDAEIGLARRWWVDAGVSVHQDLGLTTLEVDGHEVADLGSRSVWPGIAVRWR